MADQYAGARANGEAVLGTDQNPAPPRRPLTVADVGEANATDQFSAVINVHGCTLAQVERAVQDNLHEVDPHPAVGGRYVRRHPVYITAFDPSKLDEQGRPAPGQPLELDVETIRRIHAERHGRWKDTAVGDPVTHVSLEPPPEDGTHVRVAGMHTIPEYDQSGRPTGRVRLGSPDEVPS